MKTQTGPCKVFTDLYLEPLLSWLHLNNYSVPKFLKFLITHNLFFRFVASTGIIAPLAFPRSDHCPQKPRKPNLKGLDPTNAAALASGIGHGLH
jgi:hypothetical protein